VLLAPKQLFCLTDIGLGCCRCSGFGFGKKQSIVGSESDPVAETNITHEYLKVSLFRIRNTKVPLNLWPSQGLVFFCAVEYLVGRADLPENNS